MDIYVIVLCILKLGKRELPNYLFRKTGIFASTVNIYNTVLSPVEVAPSHYTSADVRDKCKGNDQTHIMARATRTAGFNVNDNWMGPKTSHAVAMSRFDKKTMIKFYKGNVSPTRPARSVQGVKNSLLN